MIPKLICWLVGCKTSQWVVIDAELTGNFKFPTKEGPVLGPFGRREVLNGLPGANQMPGVVKVEWS